jgi:hypothetical protein
MLKLLYISKSPLKTKKFRAYFNDDSHTDFGAKGYSDFTMHHDEKRKQNYLQRHSHENWSDPTSAGSLSRYILWNKHSLKDSISDFKKRFKL